MATIFTKIINGEIPSYKIAENDEFLAFLDIRPMQKGHTLVIPKIEVDYIFDLNDETLGRLMIYAKKVAIAMDSVIDCARVGVAVVGLEVPHTHIHLIPIDRVSDLSFQKEKVDLSDAELKEIAEKIGEAITN